MIIRLTFVIAGLCGVLFGCAVVWTNGMSGFPDGYKSEVTRVLLPLSTSLAWVTVVCGASIAAVAALRPQAFRPIPVICLVAAILILWVALGRYEAYLETFLNYGQGG